MAEFNVMIEQGEDGYLISEVIEIPGCHTQARTLDELMRRTKDAIKLCLETEKDDIMPIKWIGMQKIEI